MPKDHYSDALKRLMRLMEEARSRGLEDYDVAALATADSSARPSVRIVNVLAIEPEGLLFFANLDSGKGHQLVENPWAGLCFYWPMLQEQVIVEGPVEMQSELTSDRYWHRRTRASQLASWASEQSTLVKDDDELSEKLREYKAQFSFDLISRREKWQAFRVLPERLEFWPTGWHRMRERVRYLRGEAGEWVREKLAP